MTRFFGAVFVVFVCVASAQAAEVVILKSADVPYYDQAVQGFRSAIPTETKIAEYSLDGSVSNGRKIARSLRASPPDLVLAVGLKAALSAKLELTDTPAVFCLVLNPESHGLSRSNMAGVLMRIPASSQFVTIKALVPRVRRIGLLYDPDLSKDFVDEARRVTRKAGIELIATVIHDSSDLPAALKTLLPQIDLLWLIQDQTVVTVDSLNFILGTMLESKIPVFGFSPTLVQQGALGALTVNAWDMGFQAGRIGVGILHGDPIPRPPLQPPLQSQLALNVQTAEYLGLAPSKEILKMAALLYGGPGPLAHNEQKMRAP